MKKERPPTWDPDAAPNKDAYEAWVREREAKKAAEADKAKPKG